MAGRPKFEATADERKLVTVLTGCGFTQEDIASLIHEDEGGIDLKTLRKHFRKELDTGKAKTNAKVAGKLFTGCMAGNPSLLIFWAKTQMGWSHTEKHELSGPNGNPIATITAEMSPQDAARIYQDMMEKDK